MIKNKKVRIGVLIFISVCAAVAVFTAAVNIRICTFADKRILTEEEAVNLSDVDCILVLGCGVKPDGTPSAMLEDRLQRGVSLYENGVSPKILMSGDHGQDDYDEVNTMKNYALGKGVPGPDIFMDHAGFSTYESMYRAKEIFKAEKIVIVTQQYHLYRAIYIAEQLGLEAYGVNCNYRNYSGQFMRDVREVLARVKDFGMCIVQPEPTYLGEVIPVQGDGSLTNDK